MRKTSGLALITFLAGAGSAAAAQPSQIKVQAESVADLCVPAADRDRPMSDYSDAERIAMISCAQRQSARQVNAQLPNQIDEITVLERITADGARLTYHSRLALAATRITAAQRAALIEGTRNFVCSNDDMLQTMSYGGSYGYVWIDPDDVEIARTVIEGC